MGQQSASTLSHPFSAGFPFAGVCPGVSPAPTGRLTPRWLQDVAAHARGAQPARLLSRSNCPNHYPTASLTSAGRWTAAQTGGSNLIKAVCVRGWLGAGEGREVMRPAGLAEP